MIELREDLVHLQKAIDSRNLLLSDTDKKIYNSALSAAIYIIENTDDVRSNAETAYQDHEFVTRELR